MLPPVATISREQKRLLEYFDALPESERQSLLDFAEFLLSRVEQPSPMVETSVKPQDLPRPEQESVVAAMKRLSRTYHMLDTGPLLNEASTLMGLHLMQGKPAPEVIDRLHVLFEAAYQEFLGSD